LPHQRGYSAKSASNPLVLRWGPVRGYIISLCDQPVRPTQPSALSGTGKGYRLIDLGSDLRLGMKPWVGHCSLCGIATYRLSGLKKGYENPAYTVVTSVVPVPLALHSVAVVWTAH